MLTKGEEVTMKGHKHGTTSNTDEVYKTFIGCRVKGLVREITFDGHHADILVFECGWGLAFNSNGSHDTQWKNLIILSGR